MALLVINAIVGPVDLDEWIKDTFRSTLDTLDGVAGIRRFSLRRLDRDGPKCLYVSATHWEEMGAFLHWWGSDRFKAAHHGCMRYQQDRFRMLTSKRYDVADVEDFTGLDATIVGLVAEDLPALVSPQSTFTEVDIWAPAPLVDRAAR